MAIVVNGSTGYGTNASAAVLSGSNGPFTIGGWFKRNGSQSNRYLFLLANSGYSVQTALIYGYTANTVEFFKLGGSGSNPRTGSGITIADDNWHYIGFRKDGSGASGWNSIHNGVVTSISGSIDFTFGTHSRVELGYAGGGNIPNGSFAEWFAIPSAISDADIASIAGGNLPTCLGYTTGSYWRLPGGLSTEEDTNSTADLTIATPSGAANPGSVISSCAASSAPYYAILQSQPQRRFARS